MADANGKILVMAVGSREKFEDWIANRGGVQVWKNVNLSDPGRGHVFTPAMTHDRPTEKPHWAYERGEVVRDISRFVFVIRWTEIKRFRVAVRMGSQGTMLKLTDASTRKVNKTADSNPGAYYRFDYETQECVFEVPEFE